MLSRIVIRQWINRCLLSKFSGYKQNILYSSSKVEDNNLVQSVLNNAEKYRNKTALQDNIGRYTYGNIFSEAVELSSSISSVLGGKKGERVLFLCPNDASYVTTLWAIWISGQIAVPLSPQHPENLLVYYAIDTKSSLVISSPRYQEKMSQLSKDSNTDLLVLPETLLDPAAQRELGNIQTTTSGENGAMILYTSGTTGNPKGVVLTHKNIFTQVRALTSAWKWSADDVILHTLPLHHVHGTINALFCPLYMGATTLMMPKFDAKQVWRHFLQPGHEKVSVFMAVPTIYSKLIEEYETNLKNTGIDVKKVLMNDVRLMVSGSAPLPTPVYQKWLDVSGHNLLERYGMTEIGMCLSNLYDSNRAPGYVGVPLPSVSVAVADQEDERILLECSNKDGDLVWSPAAGDVIGELLVKGDSVFKEYFNKPEATRKEFVDGWFKTGDLCEYVHEEKKIRILGRKSVDIIKSGGYKISALQIETCLLEHEAIKECAVLGVPDDVYGERVGALVVLEGDAPELNLDQLKKWALERMPKYWIPTVLKLVPDIPKNAMGKVNKKGLIKEFS